GLAEEDLVGEEGVLPGEGGVLIGPDVEEAGGEAAVEAVAGQRGRGVGGDAAAGLADVARLVGGAAAGAGAVGGGGRGAEAEAEAGRVLAAVVEGGVLRVRAGREARREGEAEAEEERAGEHGGEGRVKGRRLARSAGHGGAGASAARRR